MAKATKLPSGNWRIQIYVGKNKDGNYIRKSFMGKTKKEAEVKAAQFITQKKHDDAPENKTVLQAIEDYIAVNSKTFSKSTIRGYNSIKRNLPDDFLPLPLAIVDEEVVQTALNKYAETRSKKTVKNAKQLLSPVFKLSKIDIDMKNVVSVGADKKIPYIPTNEEVCAVWDQVRGTRYEMPFVLGAFLGMRRGEIIALTWDDVDFERRTITVQRAVVWDEKEHLWYDKAPKSYDSTRVIPMLGPVYDVMWQKYNEQGPVCEITAGSLTVKFPTFLKRANVKHFRFHDLRHYFASSMLALNIPNKYIADIMGHKDETMLQRVYQHLMTDKKKEYHNRVSPMVRIGGRSNSNQRPIIKERNTKDPKTDMPNAQFLFSRKARKAPIIQHKAAPNA